MKLSQVKLVGAVVMLSTLLALTARGAEQPANEQVRVWEEPLTIPTYPMGQQDPNPIFAERRAYQGADSPIYPYPMWDSISDRRVEKTYKAVYLENRYVRICVLPEIGGRVFAALDKTNGYDFLYRQHVIKPALIGMVGAWISGGIEWNIPHHHRATTFMPVDYSLQTSSDGSAAICVGELELRHRMRWVVELRLRPDSSCVEQTVRLVNRTAGPNSFLFFANIAVSANPDYQVLFPPDVCWVTYHGKREFGKWPMADSIFNGIDFRKGVDVSWWENHPSPISMFVTGSKMDFVGGYDHGRKAGMVHVADHHISPGKKFFTWGAGEAGQAWDRALTETDGPYIELMTGSYSDNQPDYSWIHPYQTKIADAFWYPISKIGGVKNANRHVAVNLEVEANNTVRLGVAVTSEYPRLQVELSGASGVVYQKKTSADPARPFVATCPLPADAGKLTLRVLDGARELISYTPVERSCGETPEVVRPPAPPQEIAGTEEVYRAAVRLEQLHNAALDPEDYYREVLRRDPSHVKANTALGIRALQRCEYAEAEKHLQAAVDICTGSYLNPKDAEAVYFLGLTKRAQGKVCEASELFEKAAWGVGWDSPSNYQLAELACLKGDYGQAITHLDRALVSNALNVKALTLKAAVLRRLNRQPEAAGLLARAVELDPLDRWPQWENALATDAPTPRASTAPQALLEAATDYAAAGMWQEALTVLEAASGKEQATPMLKYFQAYYLEKLGKSAEAEACFAAAAEAPADFGFPFRPEAFEVLQCAREHNPKDHRAAYYLGNLARLYRQLDLATAQWEDARRMNPQFALVHRNLALVYAQQSNKLPQAIASMEKAVTLDTQEPRFLVELDQLYEAANVSVEKRLAFLEKNHAVALKRDDLLSREIALLVETGQYPRALELLHGRQFHVWEGAGRTAVHNSYSKAHLMLGQEHFKAGRYDRALEEYLAALEYPDNLGTGRPLRGERQPETHYNVARAYEALGDHAKAVQHDTKAVETAPADLLTQQPASASDPDVYYYAARALEKLNRDDEANRISEKLVEAGNASFADHVPMFFFASFGHPLPESIRFAQAHYAIGLGLLGLGKEAEARKAFEKAVALNPNHAAAREQLGSAN